MKDGEAESYRNVEVEFVPGRHAKMTVYEDGVAVGEPIDMTAVLTKVDMHQLMVDQGFTKLSAAELELKNKEKSLLLSSSTNKQNKKDQQVQRRETRNDRAAERETSRRAAREERQRQQEDRDILGTSALPSYMTLVQVYVGAVAVAVLVAVYAGVRRQRRQRRPAVLRVGLSS
jgi:hypothetical protein